MGAGWRPSHAAAGAFRRAAPGCGHRGAGPRVHQRTVFSGARSLPKTLHRFGAECGPLRNIFAAGSSSGIPGAATVLRCREHGKLYAHRPGNTNGRAALYRSAGDYRQGFHQSENCFEEPGRIGGRTLSRTYFRPRSDLFGESLMSSSLQMDVDSLAAIDVHVHLEALDDSSATDHAAKKYFGDSGAPRGHKELAEYYRSRKIAFVIFAVD